VSDEAFSRVLDELRADPHVCEGKMFGARTAQLGKKLFACLYRGELAARVGRERAAALEAAGVGTLFDPQGGRPMRGWIVLPPPEDAAGEARWLEIADEARAHLAAELADGAA
jgi:hypothetical protein